CTITFSDVQPGDTFYPYIRCLACRGIVSGYNDGTFKPGNNVTRGQLSKIVSNSANIQDVIPDTQQTFTDVPHSNPFWLWIERLAERGVMGGYSTTPPCAPGAYPCFAPYNNATRGQTAKIVANTFFPGCQTPARR